MVSRWSFQKGHLQAWPIYCRLSQTGIVDLHHARLVHKVWVPTTHNIQDTPLMNFFRCIAPTNNLDLGWHLRRSQAHTEQSIEDFELGLLWDQYEIVGDVVVSVLPLYVISRS